MDMSDIPFLAILKQRMNWLGQRQSVLSQNVANTDTPGFTARELKPVDFEKILRGAANTPAGSLTVTNPMHIATTSKNTGYKDYLVRDKEADPLGNSVSLEQEMIKVADTQAQFQAASNLYAKALGMMRTAIGKGGQ
jgi:flagellar basal-body rod protein FlgB